MQIRNYLFNKKRLLTIFSCFKKSNYEFPNSSIIYITINKLLWNMPSMSKCTYTHALCVYVFQERRDGWTKKKKKNVFTTHNFTTTITYKVNWNTLLKVFMLSFSERNKNIPIYPIFVIEKSDMLTVYKHISQYLYVYTYINIYEYLLSLLCLVTILMHYNFTLDSKLLIFY